LFDAALGSATRKPRPASSQVKSKSRQAIPAGRDSIIGGIHIPPPPALPEIREISPALSITATQTAVPTMSAQMSVKEPARTWLQLAFQVVSESFQRTKAPSLLPTANNRQRPFASAAASMSTTPPAPGAPKSDHALQLPFAKAKRVKIWLSPATTKTCGFELA